MRFVAHREDAGGSWLDASGACYGWVMQPWLENSLYVVALQLVVIPM